MRTPQSVGVLYTRLICLLMNVDISTYIVHSNREGAGVLVYVAPPCG